MSTDLLNCKNVEQKFAPSPINYGGHKELKVNLKVPLQAIRIMSHDLNDRLPFGNNFFSEGDLNPKIFASSI